MQIIELIARDELCPRFLYLQHEAKPSAISLKLSHEAEPSCDNSNNCTRRKSSVIIARIVTNSSSAISSLITRGAVECN